MFRRTDCHFALPRSGAEAAAEPRHNEYVPRETDRISAKHGRVYLDVERPRVCIRGAEDAPAADLGYPWLADDATFPFYELRSAAMDLRGVFTLLEPFGEEHRAEARRRIHAQLATLTEHGVRHVVLSAFGCGAFCNPAPEIAALYREAITERRSDFDVVAFAIFHAGYGPDNFAPFHQVFEGFNESTSAPS